MPTRDIIIATFTEVAAEQNQTIAALNDGTKLTGLGLDSLAMAVIIVRLESRLGFDPFSDERGIAAPETFGEFVALYERAVVA